MYVLIADSGSTKTDWVLLQKNEMVARHKTIGFNPYFQTKELIVDEINKNLNPHLKNYLGQITHVHYYGAGCSTADKCQLIEGSLSEALGIKNISVSHDLLAAARALCKNEWGIAAILGTGSNSCLYDGKNILENVPSVGYLWSDYGGGAQIGKYFMRDYFQGALPNDLKLAFENEGYNREVILDNVYKKTLPGKYLATVSLFVSKHIQNPHVIKILNECFDSFFIHQINKYTNSHNYKINTVGSIAYHYKDLISEAAKRHGYSMGRCIQSPMEGLIEYHSQ